MVVNEGYSTMKNPKKAGVPQQPAKELYSPYCALWPLQAMYIVNKDANGSVVWTKTKQRIKKAKSFVPTRVAIIDTSVAINHPNLSDAIDRNRTVDFFSTRLGAFPYVGGRREDGESAKLPDLRLSKASAEDVAKGNDLAEKLLKELIERLQPGADAIRYVLPATGWRFSTHGTAIAGLVGARPVTFPHVPLGNADAVMMELPFAGADPFCEMVPISTNFDPDPEQFILAFLYAELINADVVVVPRDLPDPRPEAGRSSDVGGNGHSQEASSNLSAAEADPWESLERLIEAVSRNRPIVCAGGNDGEDNVIYPARLAGRDNGVIAVGAVNAKGYTAGYSNYGDELTVMAPSNDAERFDVSEVRLDIQDADFDKEMKLRERTLSDNFSHLDVISTDVPGRFGYNGSRFAEPFIRKDKVDAIRDYGSIYCRFGGTSAAAALVGGFISLGITSGALARRSPGDDVRRWLLGKSKPSKTGTVGVPIPVWEDSPSHPDLPPPEPKLFKPSEGEDKKRSKNSSES
jgi:subtilisin family serine protease